MIFRHKRVCYATKVHKIIYWLILFLSLFLIFFSPVANAETKGSIAASTVNVKDEFFSKPNKAVQMKEYSWSVGSFISIHLTNFSLPDGDYITISSPDGSYVYRYEEKGKVVRGGDATLTNFWATHIPGNTAVLKYYSNSMKVDSEPRVVSKS